VEKTRFGVFREFASRLLSETSKSKPTFEELLPWVLALCALPKTHSSAYLNRIAAQCVYNKKAGKKNGVPRVKDTTEVEFAAVCLRAHVAGATQVLESVCGGKGSAAAAKGFALYKYVNKDVLTFHAWQLQRRRAELRTAIKITKTSVKRWQRVLDTKQDLRDEWYDKHTSRGKKLGRGYAHFFSIMELAPRVYKKDREVDEHERSANKGVEPATMEKEKEVESKEVESKEEDDVVAKGKHGGNDPYEAAAKRLYLTFTVNGKQLRVRHLLDPKAMAKFKKQTSKKKKEEKAVGKKRKNVTWAEDEGPVQKKIKEQPAGGRDDETRASNEGKKEGKEEEEGKQEEGAKQSPADTDLFELSHAKGLGFKNATALVELKSASVLAGLAKGAEVFLKLGEPPEDAAFAVACARARAAVGLESTPAGVVWLRPTADYAAIAARANPVWANGVARKMAKTLREDARKDGSVAGLVMGVFRGGRASDHPEAVDGMSLLQVLLFRKWVGCKDTNLFNLMVNPKTGKVLSVDENPANAAALRKAASRGLVTAQKMKASVLKKAGSALVAQPREVALFLKKLESLPADAAIEAGEGRLRALRGREPFDAATRALLAAAKKPGLEALARRLRLV
jgi:hypothetical protein